MTIESDRKLPGRGAVAGRRRIRDQQRLEEPRRFGPSRRAGPGNGATWARRRVEVCLRRSTLEQGRSSRCSTTARYTCFCLWNDGVENPFGLGGNGKVEIPEASLGGGKRTRDTLTFKDVTRSGKGSLGNGPLNTGGSFHLYM